MGRGPYRTLGDVVSACGRPNPFVRAAVDASTQYTEDMMEKWLGEYLADGVQVVSVAAVRHELTRVRNMLYAHLGREVPRAEHTGGEGGRG